MGSTEADWPLGVYDWIASARGSRHRNSMALVLQPSERQRCGSSSLQVAELAWTHAFVWPAFSRWRQDTRPLTRPGSFGCQKAHPCRLSTAVDQAGGTTPGFIGASAASHKPRPRGFLVIELSKRYCRLGPGHRGETGLEARLGSHSGGWDSLRRPSSTSRQPKERAWYWIACRRNTIASGQASSLDES